MKKYIFSLVLFLSLLLIWIFTKSNTSSQVKTHIIEEEKALAAKALKVHNQQFINLSTQNEKIYALTEPLQESHTLTKLDSQSPLAIPNLNSVCFKKLEHKLEKSNFKNQTLQYLNQSIIGEWFFSDLEYLDSVHPPISIIDKFYQALAMTNLLESKKIRGSYDEALKLLYEVHLEDPKNSAPLLFSSLIELRRGRKTQSLNFLKQSLRSSNHHNSYVTTLSQEIFKTIDSGENYIYAVSIWSQVPIPKVIELASLLNSEDSIVFAQQLMQNGLNDNLIINDLEWSILDYAVGAMIYKKIKPHQKILTHNEISKRKDSFNPLSKYNIFEPLENHCDFNSLNKIADLIRMRMTNTKSNL